MKNLAQIADQVLQDVAKEQLVKEAEMAYTKKTFETPAGKMLVKVAEQLRRSSEQGITYEDLARFRKAHDV